jgi:DNA topoisomerase-2
MTRKVKAKPSAKSIKAPTKLKKPVAPKKKTTQTTLKAKPTPASKKRAKPASDDEDEDLVVDDTAHDDSLLSTTPPSNKKQKKAPAKKTTSQPLAERENDAPILVDNKSKVDSTDRYQKVGFPDTACRHYAHSHS